MTQHLLREVQANGYALRRELSPHLSTAQLRDNLGTVAAFLHGNGVHPLKPQPRSAAPPNTYSGNYGLDAFPFHTDFAHWRNPPRFLMLRCVTGASDVATRLVDGWQAVQLIGADNAARTLLRTRRPRGGTHSLFRLATPLKVDKAQMPLVRWDQLFLTATNRRGAQTADAFKVAIAHCPTISVFLESPGDTLVVDNWRLLHSRDAVPTSQVSRHIERTYLELLHDGEERDARGVGSRSNVGESCPIL